MAAPSPSAASLPFNPAFPFLGIESSPRLFTEPAFGELLTGVVQAPGQAQDRTTCPAWGRAAASHLPSNLNCSPPKLPSLTSQGPGSAASRKNKPKGKPGHLRPPQKRAPPSLSSPATACLSPTPPIRSEWAAKETPVLRMRPTFSVLRLASLRKEKPIGDESRSRDRLTSHLQESTGGRPRAYGGSVGQYRFVSLIVLLQILAENQLDPEGLSASNDSPGKN